MKKRLSTGVRCTPAIPIRRIADAAPPGSPNKCDHETVEPAPILVALEQLRITGIETNPAAFFQYFDQRADIAKPQIEALACYRVNAVRSIADKRKPLTGDLRGVVEAQGVRTAPTDR